MILWHSDIQIDPKIRFDIILDIPRDFYDILRKFYDILVSKYILKLCLISFYDIPRDLKIYANELSYKTKRDSQT